MAGSEAKRNDFRPELRPSPESNRNRRTTRGQIEGIEARRATIAPLGLGGICKNSVVVQEIDERRKRRKEQS